MKLVFFVQTNGDEVGVNPSYVMRISPNKLQEDHTLLHFGKENYVSVAANLREVALKLQA